MGAHTRVVLGPQRKSRTATGGGEEPDSNGPPRPRPRRRDPALVRAGVGRTHASLLPRGEVSRPVQKISGPRFRWNGLPRSGGVGRRRCVIRSRVSPLASTKRGLRCTRAVASSTNGDSVPTVGALRGSGLRGQPGKLTAAIWRTRRWTTNGSRGAGYPKHQAPD